MKRRNQKAKPRGARPSHTTASTKPSPRPRQKPSTAHIAWVRYIVTSCLALRFLPVLADDTKVTGRHRKYEDWIHLVIWLVSGKVPERHALHSLLCDDWVWPHVVAEYHRQMGDDAPALRLPTRSAYLYCKRTRLRPKTGIFGEMLRQRAIEIGEEIGVLTPDLPPTWMNPSRAQTVTGDGTVFKSPIKTFGGPDAPLTARQRAIGCEWWTEGGSQHQMYGVAYTSICARLDDTGTRRIVYDVRRRPQKGSGGEMGQGVEMVRTLASDPRVGIRYVVWDGALRGVHADQLMSELGILPVHPVRDDDQPRALERIRCACNTEHQLFSRDTAVCEKHIDDHGDAYYVTLRVKQIRRNKDKSGYRWYNDVIFSCGRIRNVRMNTTRDTDRNRLNRAERLQPISPLQPQFKIIYGWRQDSEARHRELDDQLFIRGRMSYYVPDHQDLFMIAEAVVVNERTLIEWRNERDIENSRAA